MFRDSFSFPRTMGCFGCFGGSGRTRQSPKPYEDDTYSCDSEFTSTARGEEEEEEEEDEEEVEQKSRSKRSEEILKYRLDNGIMCRQFPVKETTELIRGEDENGNKTINEYVRECKIGSGSYGKVVLYRSTVDGQYYAIKVIALKGKLATAKENSDKETHVEEIKKDINSLSKEEQMDVV